MEEEGVLQHMLDGLGQHGLHGEVQPVGGRQRLEALTEGSGGCALQGCSRKEGRRRAEYMGTLYVERALSPFHTLFNDMTPAGMM